MAHFFLEQRRWGRYYFESNTDMSPKIMVLVTDVQADVALYA